MEKQLAELLGRREIFIDLQEIAKENDQVLKPSAFYRWMCANYVSAVTVGVRQLVDQSRGVRSLWRLLYQALEAPGAITRDSHRAMYRGYRDAIELGIPNATFDTFAGTRANSVGPRIIRGDLRALEDASDRVRRFVNKRIAHLTPKRDIRRPPTFDDLHKAIDVIDEIYCRYNCLLTARCLDSVHPTRQYQWIEVLHNAWIKPGTKFWPDA